MTYVTASNSRPSTVTQGALDFDVRAGRAAGVVTLIDRDGVLEGFGAEPGHWISASLLAALPSGSRSFRVACQRIVDACAEARCAVSVTPSMWRWVVLIDYTEDHGTVLAVYDRSAGAERTIARRGSANALIQLHHLADGPAPQIGDRIRRS